MKNFNNMKTEVKMNTLENLWKCDRILIEDLSFL